MNNISVGIKGENLACEYLITRGYRILERNYQINIGEIDIIASYGELLVFIEVKTRNSFKYGYGFEAVDKRKQGKIIKTSLDYIRENSLNDVQLRYDIIEVYLNNSVNINHIENAFIFE